VRPRQEHCQGGVSSGSADHLDGGLVVGECLFKGGRQYLWLSLAQRLPPRIGLGLPAVHFVQRARGSLSGKVAGVRGHLPAKLLAPGTSRRLVRFSPDWFNRNCGAAELRGPKGRSLLTGPAGDHRDRTMATLKVPVLCG
jgi:hypothetical protein